MIPNSRIAELLEETAVLLEIDGANPFKVRAYQRAAQVIAGLTESVCGMSEEQLGAVPGVGKSLSTHLADIVKSGEFPELAALRAKIPSGLLDLLTLPGLGPKRARMLYDTLRVDSLESLRAAMQAGKLRALRGFGPKLEASILAGMQTAAPGSKRMLYWEARELMGDIAASLRGLSGVQELSPAGSLRRGRETVGDLDVLCTARDPAAVVEAFTKLPQVERVLGAGGTKATVLLRAGIQCDLRVVPPESFGAALQYFTGSKDHNVALRSLAQRRGLTVNEYGVFKVSDEAHQRSLAGRTEEEVYKALGLAWMPPELRENRGELEAAASGKLPKLVELKDVRGDFHNHSNHTDGSHTLEEMARAAKKRGWEWVALGDHSRSLTVANGMSVDRLKSSFKELDGVRSKVKGIELLRSMEVDILKDGSLDYPDPVLSEIDVVVGSVHSQFSMEEAQMTARIVKAVQNPHLDILGHLSGRLINRRGPYKVDAEAVFKAAAASGAAIELNGQPQRQDLDDVRARRAHELGVTLALDTDAHATSQFEYMEMALITARRAWLTKDDVLNCLGFKELTAWLKDREKTA